MSTFSSFQEQQLENRSRVVKMAIIMTPIAIACLGLVGLAIYQLANGEAGFIITLFIFGTIGLLTTPLALQYLKDLTSQPVQYQGEVVKKWQKGNLLIFLMPSFYIAIDSQIMDGRVTQVVDSGCYVSMEGGGEGFVSRKELADEKPASASEVVNVGQEVKYRVTGVDGNANYRLSIRRANEYEIVSKLFSVPRLEYALLLDHDVIRITCYPHSSTVERIERYDDIEKRFVSAVDGADY